MYTPRPPKIKIIPFWSRLPFSFKATNNYLLFFFFFFFFLTFYTYATTKIDLFETCSHVELALAMICNKNRNAVKVLK